jgi:hypothetical protein
MTILLLDYNLLANQSWSSLMTLTLEQIMTTRKVSPLSNLLIKVHFHDVIPFHHGSLAWKGIYRHLLRQNILDVCSFVAILTIDGENGGSSQLASY